MRSNLATQTSALTTRVGLLIIIVAAVIGSVVYRDRLDVDLLVAWIAGFGVLAPIAFILLRVASAVVLIPASIMALIAGAAFGLVEGAIYNLVSSTAGAVLCFWIARYIAPGWIADRVAGHDTLERVVEGVESEGWRFVAFVRLVPLFPYGLLNYAFGLTRIGAWPYAIASLICMIPADIAFVYMGFAARETLAGNEGSWQLGLIALALLATLAFLPRLVRRVRRG